MVKLNLQIMCNNKNHNQHTTVTTHCEELHERGQLWSHSQCCATSSPSPGPSRSPAWNLPVTRALLPVPPVLPMTPGRCGQRWPSRDWTVVLGQPASLTPAVCAGHAVSTRRGPLTGTNLPQCPRQLPGLQRRAGRLCLFLRSSTWAPGAPACAAPCHAWTRCCGLARCHPPHPWRPCPIFGQLGLLFPCLLPPWAASGRAPLPGTVL